MTTTRKLWIGFGTLTACSIVFGMAISAGLRSIQANVEIQANEARPRSAAARALEINVLGYALDVRTFVQTDEPVLRTKAAEDAAAVELNLAEYQRLARTERQRELATRFARLWQEYKVVGQGILDSQDRPLKRSDSDRLAGLRVGLEAFLDDEMQAEAAESYYAHRDATFRDIRNLFGFATISLLVFTAVAIVLSSMVGRTVVRTERIIAEQSERLRTTLASIGDAVISTDRSGAVTYMNAVAESLTAWTNTEAAGVPLTRVFHIVNESTRRPVESPATRALKEGIVVGLANHTLLIAKDGTERPIDDCAGPIRCKDGETVGCVLVFRDVTEKHREQEKLRASEARKTAMFESALDCIISIDHEGSVIEFNASAESTFGYRREEVLGRELASLIIPPSFRELHRKGMIHYLATGEGPVLNRRIELTALRADGGEFPVELTVTRIPAKGPPLFTAYLRDITEIKRAAEALRASEENSRILFDSAPMAVFICNRNAVIQHFNRHAAELWGREPACGVEQHCGSAKLWLPDGTLLPHQQSPMVEVLRTGVPAHNVEVSIERPDGSRLPVLVNFAALKNAAGEITGAITSFVDITERKRAEALLGESEERFRVAVGAVSSLVWTNDAGGKMVGEQPGWANFTGQLEAEYQGYGWSAAVHPDDAQPTIDAWNRVVDSGDIFIFEHRVRRRDGEWRQCSIRAVPIRDGGGGIREWVGVHTDVTDAKQSELQLRQLAARLSEADRRKDEFLATLAHELRNPLAPIRNGLEVMRRVDLGEDIEAIRAMMERQIGQMIHLVDDLLDVSRVSRGKIQLRTERVELATALNHAVETSRPVIDAGGHELAVDLPPEPVFLDADANRLAQIFANLLNNSAKYSERGGRIRLSAERRGDHVAVSVKDTGLGIPPKMLPKIFEMFTQVDGSLEKSQGGLGIGLTLVKRLVEMHGGTVEARSEGRGRGSEFVVRLPVATEVAVVEPAKNSEGASAVKRHYRILVADDNEDGAATLAMILEILGHEVCTANDGAAAVEVASAFRPDVILLDIGMPKLNGYEACRRIREEPWGENIAIVAVTGWGQDEDRRRSREAGFDHHMVKPVAPAALEKLLAGLTHSTASSPRFAETVS